MSRVEVIPFADEHLDAAGELLAARQRRHREREPLLPERFTDPAVARDEVEALWRADDTPGAVAVRDGRVAGYLLGIGKDESWGPNVWVENAGHAAEEPELVRDLYASAAAEWVAAGRKAHYAVAPGDPASLEPWYRLGFGQQQAYGVRELPAETAWPEGARMMRREDFDQLIELAPKLADHQEGSPVFSPVRNRETSEEIRKELEDDMQNHTVASLVAELDGRIVGNFYVVPVEMSQMHTSVTRCEGSSFIGFAVTDPNVRGAGAGLRLTDAAYAWSHEKGYDRITADWRVTNLLASRFWSARGFRTSFVRLHRLIG
jgi:ribosomal protein S18 acetylase RimI-like enzyme